MMPTPLTQRKLMEMDLSRWWEETTGDIFEDDQAQLRVCEAFDEYIESIDDEPLSELHARHCGEG